MRGAALALLTALAACSPTEVADKVGRRAAETVVLPVVSESMPSGPAATVTRCVVENATAAEVQALARDVGVTAGTTTRATILAIATRPETVACVRAAGGPGPALL